MPGRNIVKANIADSYYHVYARGINKQQIFLDDADFGYFKSLLQRYLSPTYVVAARGANYQKLNAEIQLLSYCFMQNHFHLLVYQINEHGMAKLMKCLLSSYGMYFNRKYNRLGPLLESRYRASRISSEDYLLHITRYIHLNPRDWKIYAHSSLPFYLEHRVADWINPTPITKLFGREGEYLEFLEEYEETRDTLDKLKHELADQ